MGIRGTTAVFEIFLPQKFYDDLIGFKKQFGLKYFTSSCTPPDGITFIIFKNSSIGFLYTFLTPRTLISTLINKQFYNFTLLSMIIVIIFYSIEYLLIPL